MRKLVELGKTALFAETVKKEVAGGILEERDFRKKKRNGFEMGIFR